MQVGDLVKAKEHYNTRIGIVIAINNDMRLIYYPDSKLRYQMHQNSLVVVSGGRADQQNSDSKNFFHLDTSKKGH